MSINFGKTEVIGKSKFAPVYIARRRIDVDPLEHTDAREIGAEWLCLQAVRQLRVEGFLRSLGWTEEDVKIVIAHLITHTPYTRHRN